MKPDAMLHSTVLSLAELCAPPSAVLVVVSFLSKTAVIANNVVISDSVIMIDKIVI